MNTDIDRHYGAGSHFDAALKPNSDSVVLFGMTDIGLRLTRVLSSRAAQVLWFALVRQLFPTQSQHVVALLHTAPMRSPALPTITTHLTAERLDDGKFEVVGESGGQSWAVTLDEREAQRLWRALHRVLYPTEER